MPGTNPIYRRLTRRSRLPSPRAAMWAAFGVGLALTVFLTWQTLTLRSRYTLAGGWLAIVGAIFALLSPLISAVIAATLTARDAQGGELRLVLLTGIEQGDIIRGYVAAALHRCRWLLALLVALWPAVVIGWLQLRIQMLSVYFNGPGALPLAETGVRAVVNGTLIFGGLMLALWAEDLVAVVAGVGLALVRRNAVVTGIGAAVMALVNIAMVGTPVLFVMYLGLFPLVWRSARVSVPIWLGSVLGPALFVALLVAAGTLVAALRLARRSLGAEK